MSPASCRTVKRIFDIVISLITIVLLAPMLLGIAVVSLAVQGPPLLYVSRRYVAVDRAVSIYKFRTMVRDAASHKYDLKGRYLRGGFLDVPSDCEVYTPLGKFLERTQIVELPQILNVLKDGLSWVGNRALPDENIALLGQFSGWEERFASPCGLTGVSQIVGKGNLDPLQRITLEREYAKVYTEGNVLRADLLILLATVRLVFLGRSASYDEALGILHGSLPAPVRNQS